MSALIAAMRLELGERLGRVVATRGLSHAAFAEAYGIHQTTLSACIRGEMSVERVIRILEQVGEHVAFKSQVGDQSAPVE
jgi:predicted XRE-type DNA-binding protein